MEMPATSPSAPRASASVAARDGFAMTAEACRHCIHAARLDGLIRTTLAELDPREVANLGKRGAD